MLEFRRAKHESPGSYGYDPDMVEFKFTDRINRLEVMTDVQVAPREFMVCSQITGPALYQTVDNVRAQRGRVITPDHRHNFDVLSGMTDFVEKMKEVEPGTPWEDRLMKGWCCTLDTDPDCLHVQVQMPQITLDPVARDTMEFALADTAEEVLIEFHAEQPVDRGYADVQIEEVEEEAPADPVPTPADLPPEPGVLPPTPEVPRYIGRPIDPASPVEGRAMVPGRGRDRTASPERGRTREPERTVQNRFDPSTMQDITDRIVQRINTAAGTPTGSTTPTFTPSTGSLAGSSAGSGAASSQDGQPEGPARKPPTPSINGYQAAPPALPTLQVPTVEQFVGDDVGLNQLE